VKPGFVPFSPESILFFRLHPLRFAFDIPQVFGYDAPKAKPVAESASPGVLWRLGCGLANSKPAETVID
jgi:hypothetical protein